MAALFHLIFEFLKITILSGVYSALILICLLIVERCIPINKLKIIYIHRGSRAAAWWRNAKIIGLLLFIFMLTYWGDHGLGDESNIPIGHGKQIKNTDGAITYINVRQESNGQAEVSVFSIIGDTLCAAKLSDRGEPDGYFIYTSQDNKIKHFENNVQYHRYAAKHNLPLISSFKDFFYHYNKYWNGWRLWLLP